jgi:hypothetical protein
MPIQAAKMSMKRESWQPGRNRSNTVGVSNGISGLIGYRAMVFMKAVGWHDQNDYPEDSNHDSLRRIIQKL